VQVLITDLTRMYDGHICAAGIDLSSGKRVRPVLRVRIPARMLAAEGGVFDVGTVVDLGRTRWCGKPPEVEDVLFGEHAVRPARTIAGSEFFELLRKHAGGSVEQVIGGELVREGNSLVTPAGRGKRSLVMTFAQAPVQVALRPSRDERDGLTQRIRFMRTDGVDLSVTDVRLYKRDMITPDEERVRWLQARLAEQPEVILCFGLGRPFNGRHYLQLNNVHLSHAPDWRVASV
jgi:hypothetical protein